MFNGFLNICLNKLFNPSPTSRVFNHKIVITHFLAHVKCGLILSVKPPVQAVTGLVQNCKSFCVCNYIIHQVVYTYFCICLAKNNLCTQFNCSIKYAIFSQSFFLFANSDRSNILQKQIFYTELQETNCMQQFALNNQQCVILEKIIIKMFS